MSLERKLLAACIKSREAFERIEDNLEGRISLPISDVIIDCCKEYYARDGNATSVDIDYLLEHIATLFDNPKKAAEYQDFVREINGLDISTTNIIELILSAKRKEVGHKLAAALANDSKDIPELIEAYQSVADRKKEEKDETFHNVSIEQSIATVLNKDNLIKLPTKVLNDAVDGGALAGHHIVVFARPETGKTALCVSFIRAFAYQQLDGIYFGNEDPIQSIILRTQCAFAGLTKEELRTHPSEAQRAVEAAGFGYARFIPLNPGSPQEIVKYVKMYKPKWIVVDQLRNLAVRADTRVNQLEAAATAIRNIAGKWGLLAISVTQAGDSADNKLVLGMGDVDFSNCLAKGTEVLMFDGSKKAVQSIVRGELVMGMDGTPRTVLATGSGRQPMYKITHKNGDSYVVNQSHIMVVKNSDTVSRAGIGSGEIGDLPLQNLLDKPYLKSTLKGIWFSGREFPEADLLIDPYLFGLWLADGFSHTFSIATSDSQLRDFLLKEYAHLTPATRIVNCTSNVISFNTQPNGHKNPENDKLRQLGVFRNKHIPASYLTASRAQRLRMLAGIIDGDGSMRRSLPDSADSYSIYVGDNETLADNVLELCKSLGFYCMKGKSHPTCFVIRLSGNVSEIECTLDRKKAVNNSQIDFLASNLVIEKVSDDGEYFGISVDNDERYVLGNYIVTHNTGIPAQADLMVGMGVNAEYESQNMRMLSLPKNKLGGKHIHFPVRLNPFTSRVEDL